MDSKRKFIKNQQWKKKYKPRNPANVKIKKKLEDAKDSAEEKESEEEATLKQPIPEAGWFPEYESSSSSDDEDYLKNISKPTTDKNWFEKELDNIEVIPSSSRDGNEHVDHSERVSLASIDSVRKSFHKSLMKSKRDEEKVRKSSPVLNNDNDDDDEELDFLLSLKEPVYSGPVIVEKITKNDRRLASGKNKLADQKPIKTIDLEKWLDTVLDE